MAIAAIVGVSRLVVNEIADVRKEKGVEFAQELKKEDWGTSAILKDPDGNMYVLSTP